MNLSVGQPWKLEQKKKREKITLSKRVNKFWKWTVLYHNCRLAQRKTEVNTVLLENSHLHILQMEQDIFNSILLRSSNKFDLSTLWNLTFPGLKTNWHLVVKSCTSANGWQMAHGLLAGLDLRGSLVAFFFLIAVCLFYNLQHSYHAFTTALKMAMLLIFQHSELGFWRLQKKETHETQIILEL